MQYSEEEKAMRLEDWRQGGKNAWAYAKTNGLNPQTFAKQAKTGAEEKPAPCLSLKKAGVIDQGARYLQRYKRNKKYKNNFRDYKHHLFIF